MYWINSGGSIETKKLPTGKARSVEVMENPAERTKGIP